MNPKDFWPPGDQFYENQHNFPPEELAKYYGRHVAYSWDGASIVASGASIEEVEENLKAAGLDPTRVVFGYVPDGLTSELPSVWDALVEDAEDEVELTADIPVPRPDGSS